LVGNEKWFVIEVDLVHKSKVRRQCLQWGEGGAQLATFAQSYELKYHPWQVKSSSL
jgi:hypothetical protein